MDYEKFKNSPSGKLVKAIGTDGPYQAFVPNPLPPDLSALLSDFRLTNKLADASLALGALRSPSNVTITPILRFILMQVEALRSSELEGTFSIFEDVYAFGVGQLPLFPSDPESVSRVNAAREVKNYITATEYGFERLNNLPVSKRLFRELHQRLMDGVRGEEKAPGEFRRFQNAIGSHGDSFANARYVPPPPDKMMAPLEQLELFINSESEFHPLINLALIHYQFEAIHPFMDGNGRIGRLMLPLILHQWGFLPEPLLYMSLFFQRHKETYKDFLYGVSASGAWQDWIMFFLDGVIEQSNYSLEIMGELQDLKVSWHKSIEGEVSKYIPRLVDHIFDDPLITVREIADHFGVTLKGASKWIKKLVSLGILVEFTTVRNAKVYTAPEVLRIVSR